MADNYISTNMETGVKVKEALERIEAYQPGLFVWKEISDAITVDLKSPTTYSGITDPGDYVIYKFSNGPSAVPSTLAPVLLSIRNGKNCITVNGVSYLYDAATDGWVLLENTSDDITKWIKSDSAPLKTTNVFWFDTSMKNDTEDPHVDLKYYDTDSNEWTSVFNTDKYIKKSELDPESKELDIFDYVVNRIADVLGEYGEFLKHINNEGLLVHVSADDRNRYANLITEAELREMLNDIYKPAINTLIEETIDGELQLDTITNKIESFNDDLAEHIENHISAEDIARWNNKAEGDHTHDYTSGDQKIDASQITSGTISADKLPDEVKERYYAIIKDSAETEFSNSEITDADRTSKYHNGNGFYLAYTDDSGITKYKWYRIIDQTKIGTSDWESGVVEFTAKDSRLVWDNISGRPTTLDEFGIETDLYTKDQIDKSFDAYKTLGEQLLSESENYNGECSFEFTSDSKIESIGIQEVTSEPSEFGDLATGKIPQTDIIVKTTDGKIYKTTKNLNSTYRFNSNERTTENAAESFGTGFVEVPMKEYEKYSSDNSRYDQLIYFNGYWYSMGTSGSNGLRRSKSGLNWKAVRWLDDYLTEQGESLDLYTDNVMLSVYGDISIANDTLFVAVQGYYLGYTTNGETWKVILFEETQNQLTNIIYVDNMYYATGTGGLFKSTDRENWNACAEYDNYTGIALFHNNGKYIHVYSSDNTIYIATSTDFITWEVKNSGGLKDENNIYYFNNRYYQFNEATVMVFDEETYTPEDTTLTIDGNEVEPYGFYATSMWVDDVNNTAYITYIRKEDNRVILASSTDGIAFITIYTLGDSGVIPLKISYHDGNFVVVGENGGGGNRI